MTEKEILKVFEDDIYNKSESYKGVLYSFCELVEFDLIINDEIRDFKTNMIYIDRLDNKLVFTDLEDAKMHNGMGLTFVYKLYDIKEIKR